jgi:hypothetical protein
MAERNRPHIHLRGRSAFEPYRRPRRKINPIPFPVPADRLAHGRALLGQLTTAETEAQASRGETGPPLEGTTPGIYVVFESFPGLELALERLDPRQGRSHPELVSVREVVIDGLAVMQATVRIPDGKAGYFLGRIEKYLETATADRPNQGEFVDRVQSIRLATLAQLWTDSSETFPAEDASVWWEVWLRRHDNQEIARLRSFAERVHAQVSPSALVLLDRVVTLVRATRSELAGALDVLDDLAELRGPSPHAEFIAGARPVDQAEWVADIAARTSPAPTGNPAVCILDTGVHQAHPLLSHSLAVVDCHTCDPTWGTSDHKGHGTEMAGLALYGNLGAVLESTGSITLRHRLESAKFLPPNGTNPEELYGAVTAIASSLVEIQAPERHRVFCLATTADLPIRAAGEPTTGIGQPTSWSAAVDALAAGHGIARTADGLVMLDRANARDGRLFVAAAGNIDDVGDDYLTWCDLQPVEDPGHAWNAVTIGAYTDLTVIPEHETGFRGWTPLAPRGELSPYSRTSVAFDRAWPMKPDVVVEGGNVARSPAGTDFDWPDSYQRLTTKRPTQDARLLTVTRQTSAATAQAAHLAASIMAEYPGLWPETVRALIVHSADWTPAMQARFDGAPSRQARDSLRRRYGMGVPSLLRATRSAADALTLIAEDSIHPYDGEGRMREMRLHRLPWPNEVLSDLGATPVRLRVTLSYFIEPNPGRRGWARRYRYQSHGLRFEVRRPTETDDGFRGRINLLAREEGDGRVATASDAAEWLFGPDLRSSGSIHSDIWEGTAADLARRGVIAVYPVTGWWKEFPKLDQSERGARYSLIVSIETPGQAVDIWTPVAAQVGIPVTIET